MGALYFAEKGFFNMQCCFLMGTFGGAEFFIFDFTDGVYIYKNNQICFAFKHLFDIIQRKVAT